MSARSRLARSLVSVGLLTSSAPLFWTQLAYAQEAVQVQPDVENSRYQFSGSINSPDVYVRSGPGDAWYATEKLSPGTPVTVVGIKYDWLKILPPADSFCYVSKLYVDRRGDGTIGRVTRPDINVRAGSTVSEVKTTVLAKLDVGDDVKIVGEQDEYYKIAPPTGTFLYVNKQFVDPVKALAVNAVPVDTVASAAGGDQPATRPSGDVVGDAVSPDASERVTGELAKIATSATGGAATTQPSDALGESTAAAAPSPSDAALISFNAAETDFRQASDKPLEDQPIADLAKRYETLSQNAALDDTDKQTAGFRLAVLKVRLDSQSRLVDMQKVELAAAERTKSLKAEQDELQKRLLANDVKLYAAVGTLQASSLQFGSDTLYRLVDPATSRTVVYIRGDQATALGLVGQFVGVRGDAVTDDWLNIKVIPFTVLESVDPTQVNTKVIAGIIPPSFMAHVPQAPAAPQANTGG